MISFLYSYFSVKNKGWNNFKSLISTQFTVISLEIWLLLSKSRDEKLLLHIYKDKNIYTIKNVFWKLLHRLKDSRDFYRIIKSRLESISFKYRVI